MVVKKGGQWVEVVMLRGFCRRDEKKWGDELYTLVIPWIDGAPTLNLYK